METNICICISIIICELVADYWLGQKILQTKAAEKNYAHSFYIQSWIPNAKLVTSQISDDWWWGDHILWPLHIPVNHFMTEYSDHWLFIRYWPRWTHSLQWTRIVSGIEDKSKDVSSRHPGSQCTLLWKWHIKSS